MSTARPANTVTITAVVENLGRSVQLPYHSCSEPGIRVYDAQGDELLLNDPRFVSVCLQEPYFRAGQRWVIKVYFNGVHYAADGTHLTAPAGTYRAVTSFAYISPSGPETLEREATFEWQ
jgi:hypothetical protein